MFVEHQSQLDEQVIGVPDDRLGEELCAWIRKKPESQITEAELKEFCKKEVISILKKCVKTEIKVVPSM